MSYLRRHARRFCHETLESRELLAIFTVSNLNDSGLGSLRQATIDANEQSGPDEILFAAGVHGTIHLVGGPLTISESVRITGPGAEQLTIDAQGNSRVLFIHREFDNFGKRRSGNRGDREEPTCRPNVVRKTQHHCSEQVPRYFFG